MKKAIGCLLLCAVCFFAGSLAAYKLTLSREVVRFRVIANSDSERDQMLKCRVRDGVLSALEGVPREALEEQMPRLENMARDILRENGDSSPVGASLCRERFERSGDALTDLPSGTYETLCLTIGQGKGHNWWGVLYPKLCYGEQSCLETGTERQLRFFILEKLEQLQSWAAATLGKNGKEPENASIAFG